MKKYDPKSYTTIFVERGFHGPFIDIKGAEGVVEGGGDTPIYIMNSLSSLTARIFARSVFKDDLPCNYRPGCFLILL